MELEEALTPGTFAETLAKKDILAPRYWVACRGDQVVGLGGLTDHPADRHEAVWGGWTVFAPEWRCDLSRARFMMLQKLAREIVASKRTFFRLYTSDLPEERQANLFYDHLGMEVYQTRPGEDGKSVIYYRQAEIRKVIDLFHRQFLTDYRMDSF